MTSMEDTVNLLDCTGDNIPHTPEKDGQKCNRNLSLKRTDYIDSDEYLMAIACLVAKRSKDPSSQVGACIVNPKNQIVGQGYNGMPHGCSDDEFPWNKISSDPLNNKYLYVCHAELNAILNSNCKDISGCKIYSVLFPCNECAKIIIQAGIKMVIYMSGKNMNKVEAEAAMKMFKAAGVSFRQYTPKHNELKIDFSENATRRGLEYLTPGKSTSFNSGRLISPEHRNITTKRQGVMEWEEYFMAITFLIAKRSKDPLTQLGACIVNSKNRIIGVGYNGMPFGCSDDVFPWGMDSKDPLENKELYVCHAESNAILNSNGMDMTNCRMYCVTFPCNECAKTIIMSRIQEIIFMSEEYIDQIKQKAAKRMFDAAGVVYSLQSSQANLRNKQREVMLRDTAKLMRGVVLAHILSIIVFQNPFSEDVMRLSLSEEYTHEIKQKAASVVQWLKKQYVVKHDELVIDFNEIHWEQPPTPTQSESQHTS